MQMTLNGAREHSLYKVCEEHFAGKIGKCSGSLNNENLHFHFVKKPEAPPSCFEIRNDVFTYRLQTFTSSKTICMLAASGLPGNSLHCFTSWRPSALPGFFGISQTHRSSWMGCVHPRGHAPATSNSRHVWCKNPHWPFLDGYIGHLSHHSKFEPCIDPSE